MAKAPRKKSPNLSVKMPGPNGIRLMRDGHFYAAKRHQSLSGWIRQLLQEGIEAEKAKESAVA